MNSNHSLILMAAWVGLAYPLHAEKPSKPDLSSGEAITYWRVDVEHKAAPAPTEPSVPLDSVAALSQERAKKAFPRTKSATGTRDGDTWEVTIAFEDGKKQPLWFAHGYFLNRSESKYYGTLYNVIEPIEMGGPENSVPFLNDLRWIAEDTYVKDSVNRGQACHVYISKTPVTLPYADQLAKNKASIASVYIDKKTKLPISAENESTILSFKYERPAGVKVDIPPEARAALDSYLRANSPQ